MTHTFPSVEQLAEIDPIHLAVPQARRRTVSALVDAIAEGTVILDAGCDWMRARRQLLDLPGVGPWTAEMIAMRGLGDPNAFPASDLGLKLAAKQLGLPDQERSLDQHSQRWRPGLLCHPALVDRSRTSGEPMATQGATKGLP